MNMNQAREIQEMASKISERFAPDKIILFGSHARGDAQEDSDVDLLVLFSELDDPRRRATELYVAPGPLFPRISSFPPPSALSAAGMS
jgi:predicted nucleotidyltransferase